MGMCFADVLDDTLLTIWIGENRATEGTYDAGQLGYMSASD
jgi:hypothetical protein